MGALEAPLSSEPWLGDGLTFDLLLHLLPLLAGQQKVEVLSGDIFTVGLLVHTEICRKLPGKISEVIHIESNGSSSRKQKMLVRFPVFGL